MKTIKVIGHAPIVESLIGALGTDQLHQGLLFSGPEGIGKRTTGEFLAQGILCEGAEAKPCGTCASCLLVQSGNHPDAFSFDPSIKDQGSVEALRNLLQRLSMQSFRGHAKVVLIDNADHFSVAAANIFLKTLEEPRPGLFFILIATNVSRLPMTIRSRVQRWEFQPLSKEEMKAVLAQHKEIVVDKTELLELADGSITQLQKLLAKEDIVSDLQQFVRKTVLENRITEAFIFIQGIAKDKEALADAFSFLIPIVRNELRKLVSHERDTADMTSRLALLLGDLITAQYVIFERNINPLIVLTDIVNRCLVSAPDMSRTALQPTLAEQVKGY